MSLIVVFGAVHGRHLVSGYLAERNRTHEDLGGKTNTPPSQLSSHQKLSRWCNNLRKRSTEDVQAVQLSERGSFSWKQSDLLCCGQARVKATLGSLVLVCNISHRIVCKDSNTWCPSLAVHCLVLEQIKNEHHKGFLIRWSSWVLGGACKYSTRPICEADFYSILRFADEEKNLAKSELPKKSRTPIKRNSSFLVCQGQYQREERGTACLYSKWISSLIIRQSFLSDDLVSVYDNPQKIILEMIRRFYDTGSLPTKPGLRKHSIRSDAKYRVLLNKAQDNLSWGWFAGLCEGDPARTSGKLETTLSRVFFSSWAHVRYFTVIWRTKMNWTAGFCCNSNQPRRGRLGGWYIPALMLHLGNKQSKTRYWGFVSNAFLFLAADRFVRRGKEMGGGSRRFAPRGSPLMAPLDDRNVRLLI